MRFGYSVYGIRVDSDRAFPELENVSSHSGRALGRVQIRAARSIVRFSKNRIPSWESYNHLSYGFESGGDTVFIRSPHVGTIRVAPARRLIQWQPSKKGNELRRVLIRGRALGLMLSYSPDRYLLHGTTLVIDDRAVTLCGAIGHGKSTLSAQLLNGRFDLVSDDLTVISRQNKRLVVHSGPPEIRLWPKTLDEIGGGKVRGDSLYPETTKMRCLLHAKTAWRFSKRPARLCRVYVLSRGGQGQIVRFETLKGSAAVLALLANAYMPIVADPAVACHRLEWASRIAKAVRVRRLIYPSGFEHLPKVREAIVKDVRAG